MADLLFGNNAKDSTPGSGNSQWFVDSTAKIFCIQDDAGRVWGQSYNAAIASQGAGFAADTWVTNSDLLIPSFGVQAKTSFLWTISGSKTGAGTATPIYTIRTGANRSTGDTSRLALTGPAQTAIADKGILYIMATMRTIGGGSAAVLQGTAWWDHTGTQGGAAEDGTGFANDGAGVIEGTSAGFDSTGLAGQYISLSINGGTSASWTITQVQAQANW